MFFVKKIEISAMDIKFMQFFSKFEFYSDLWQCTNEIINVSLCCKLLFAGLLTEANSVFEDMLADGVVPDTVVYTALISALNQSGHPKKALEFAASLQHKCFNEVTYMELLAACSK